MQSSYHEQYLEAQGSYNQAITVTQVQPSQPYLRGSEVAYKYSSGLVITTLDLQVLFMI